jgi:hypothetical protein
MGFSELRRQLDALMDKNRDHPSGVTLKHFSDRDVCKHYLCGCCPHDLFQNTIKEVGICPNLHSEQLRIQYEVLDISKKKEFGYEQRLGRFLDDLVYECDKTIERQEHKLTESESEKMENRPMILQITSLQTQLERAGEEGKVDEYIKLSSEISLLEQKRQQVMFIPPVAAREVIQQQSIRVCEVCSCFLSKFDTDKRLVDHFNGKLHVGYVNIREKLQVLKLTGLYNPDENQSEL